MSYQRNLPKLRKAPKTPVSTLISMEAWSLAMANKVRWNEALEFGIRFLAAEKTEESYPPCDLLNKNYKLQDLIKEKNKEIAEDGSEKEC